jgi:hypothetical protein
MLVGMNHTTKCFTEQVTLFGEVYEVRGHRLETGLTLIKVHRTRPSFINPGTLYVFPRAMRRDCGIVKRLDARYNLKVTP